MMTHYVLVNEFVYDCATCGGALVAVGTVSVGRHRQLAELYACEHGHPGVTLGDLDLEADEVVYEDVYEEGGRLVIRQWELVDEEED